MGVKCNMTSAYHPQSNGLDERFNQTLQHQLLKYVSEEQRDWDLYLDAILFSYRVSRQDSTKMSPFLLVYGRQPRLPVEFSINSTLENGDEDERDGGSQEEEKSPVDENEDSGSYKGDENEKDSGSQEGDENEKDSGSQEENEDEKDSGGHEGDENEKDNGGQEDKKNSTDKVKKDDGSQEEGIGLEEHICKMVTIRRKALENIKVAQERQKVHYDAKHCQDKARYKVGALVLVKNSLKLSRKGPKMAPNWLGPYRIHEVLNKGTFRLSQVKDGKKVLAQLYNMTRLKLYYHREDSDQITDDKPTKTSPSKLPAQSTKTIAPEFPVKSTKTSVPKLPVKSTKTSVPKLPVQSTKTSAPKLPVQPTKTSIPTSQSNLPKQASPNSQSNPPKQAPPNSQSNPPKQAPPNSQSNPPKQAPPNCKSNLPKQAPPTPQSNPLKQACHAAEGATRRRAVRAGKRIGCVHMHAILVTCAQTVSKTHQM